MSYWDIPHNSITMILIKRKLIRIEYKTKIVSNFIEVSTSYSIIKKLERELEKIGKPIQKIY